MLYVAYGSNLDDRQMAFRCPDAVEVGTGVIEDFRLFYRGSKTGCYATIEKCEGEKVYVEVWEISDRDEKSLDRYEGFPKFYYKKSIDVHMNDGTLNNAMVYIMDKNRPVGLPSKEYYNVIARSYERLGFDKSELEKSIQYTRKMVK